MSESDLDLAGLVDRLRRFRTDTTGVEVKAAAGGLPKSLGETLSAFANGTGGVVILGLSERDGFTPAPGFDSPSIQDGLARLCSDDMEPPVRASLDIVDFEGAQAVVLEVPGLDPVRKPSYVKHRGPFEGSFIRGGDGDRHLTAYEVTQLLANHGQPTEDAEIVPGATVDDFDSDRVAEVGRRLRNRSPRAFGDIDDERLLLRLGAAVRDEDGTVRPTLAGIMCLGIYPQQFFPQLFVSFVALPGRVMGESLEDGTRFLDNVTCDGPIPEMLATVIAAARRNMRTAAVIKGIGREDRHDYPIEVIRELIVNALLHRDYSPLSRGTQVQVELYPDRLVVKNPGGLYGSIVPSELGVIDVSSTRNAVLAKMLADIPSSTGEPVCENRASGLPRVFARLRDAGMSPPHFDATFSHVHVTVPQPALLDPDTSQWIADLRSPGLDDAQHLALAMMRASGTVSNEMLRVWGVESKAATAALRNLVDRDLAVKRGGRRYATYELVDDPDRQLPAMLPFYPANTPTGPRQQRIDAELQSVIEAIRAGHITSRSIAAQLGLSYATAIRRLNTLLEAGRISATAPTHSRTRTYVVADSAGSARA
ncbi:ATP-binding protein [soil metagenome]